MSDPFTLLGFEKKYDLDITLLDQAYFEAQKKTHPDQFTKASPEEKIKASKHSAALNQAYLLLKDPLKRAELLLKQANIEFISHNPVFLQQVIEWKEQIKAKKDIREELATIQGNFFNNLKKAFIKKDYEMARLSFYQLTYMHKLLKEIC